MANSSVGLKVEGTRNLRCWPSRKQEPYGTSPLRSGLQRAQAAWSRYAIEGKAREDALNDYFAYAYQ